MDNLLGRTLEAIDPDVALIKKLLAAAELNIKDASIKGLSTENRFDIGYKAIMQLANAALQANGFRTLSSVPGHHQTMIQSLAKTIGLERSKIIQIDAMRKQRNIIDYSGDVVSNKQCDACLMLAKELFKVTITWLQEESELDVRF